VIIRKKVDENFLTVPLGRRRSPLPDAAASKKSGEVEGASRHLLRVRIFES
jgi:hypothetical protein